MSVEVILPEESKKVTFAGAIAVGTYFIGVIPGLLEGRRLYGCSYRETCDGEPSKQIFEVANPKRTWSSPTLVIHDYHQVDIEVMVKYTYPALEDNPDGC